MTDFGWTRLAYLLVVLSILAALVQLGSADADPRPLAAEPPDMRTVAEVPPADAQGSHEHPTPQAGAAPRENPAAPAFARHLRRATVGGASAASGAGRAVFYRPPPPSPSPGPSGVAPGPGPACGDLGRFPSGHRLVFPLPMGYANSYDDTWGAPRPQGGHEGTDLMAPAGTPEYAATDGTIVPVTGSNGNGWNTLGGYALMLRAAYSVGPVKEGDLFYYAHLEKESALPLGATVRAGQVVGYAGDTGQGPEVTRGLFPPHLHLGWYDATGARSYLPSGAMNPYPLLEWITAGGGVLGGGSKARYCEIPRSGPPIPSAGEDRWPAARDAGARPDLDTGSERPAPGKHQAGHTKKATQAKPQDRTPGRHLQGAPGRASPEPHPRAPISPFADPKADETPGKPGGGEPPHAAPQAGQSPEGGSHAPSFTPESQPAEAEGSDRPDEGREPEGEEGKGENEESAANHPGGDADGEKPEGQNPEEEKPEKDLPPPDAGTALDESEPSFGTGSAEDPETTVPEATVPETGGSEDENGEQETTSAPPG